MKQFTLRRWIYVFIAITFVACKGKDAGKQFEINGIIANSTAKKIYLEEVPAGSTQGTIVDSAVINKDGKYKLTSGAKESVVYNLRLDENQFPVAAVINDVPKMTLNVDMKKGDDQFAEKYEVKGSPVSQQMKDFMYQFDNDLQKIYYLSRQADSLKKINTPDSLIFPLIEETKQVANKLREYSLDALTKANDPALFIFELGYYQFSANEYGLQAVDIEQVSELINKASGRFPAHQGLNAVKGQVNEQMVAIKKSQELKWVGKPAPDFSLPDPTGKEVKLSSFRGKYVLVDFWASWCRPCREENPNVVKAYQKFKDKNFAILGVSLDHPGDKDKWMTAVMKDNLTWTQVSDLKGWESVVVAMYDFGQVGIPYNILVDPEGVVIGERLTGAALETKLNEVLK